MTRVQVAVRIITLQEAISLLEQQAKRDGYGPFGCLRAMEVAMRGLEYELRLKDLALHSQTGSIR